MEGRRSWHMSALAGASVVLADVSKVPADVTKTPAAAMRLPAGAASQILLGGTEKHGYVGRPLGKRVRFAGFDLCARACLMLWT